MWDKMVYKVIYIHCNKMSLIGLLCKNRLVVVNITYQLVYAIFQCGVIHQLSIDGHAIILFIDVDVGSNKLGSILKVRRGEHCQVYVIEK